MRTKSITLLLLVIVCVCFSDLSRAAEVTENKPMTREEMIKEHNKNLAKLLAERKKKADEKRQQEIMENRRLRETQRTEAERLKSITGTPAPGKPVPTGTLLSLRGSNEAESLLFFKPVDISVQVGKRFLSDLWISNPSGKKIDQIALSIAYDPKYLKPLKVYDFPIHPSVQGQPSFTKDSNLPILYYRATLKNPQSFAEQLLLKIAWEAVKETVHTKVGFVFGEQESRLLSKGSDLLGTKTLQDDGYIPLGVSIYSGRSRKIRTSETDWSFLSGSGTRTLKLRLLGTDVHYRAGEEFEVSLYLDNPDNVFFDHLNLEMSFDPERLEVVDWDKNNWIRRGINIYDGVFHKEFPFDIHLQNKVNNLKGTISYTMGSSQELIMKSGVFGRIRFRAKRPVEGSSIRILYPEGKDANRATAITYLGESVLSSSQSVNRHAIAQRF